MAEVGKTLIVLGLLMFVGAVVWWYAFFEQFFGSEVKQASECFYYRSEMCALSSLTQPISDVPPYSPVLLWVAVAIFACGVLVLAATPLRRARDR